MEKDPKQNRVSNSAMFAFFLFFAFIMARLEIAFDDITTKLDNIALAPKQQQIAKMLRVYDVYSGADKLELYRHGREHDGGYVLAKRSLNKADILLGYGIADDNSFEDQFSLQYLKPSIGFDCSVDKSPAKSELYSFVSECISSDASVYFGKSSGKVSSFSEQLTRHKLADKKIFIKMDIEGAEYGAFEDIFQYAKQITGIVLEVHMKDSIESYDKALRLLRRLDENFVLVHLHGNNCCPASAVHAPNIIGKLPLIFELSYINNNLIDKAVIAKEQSYPKALDIPNLPHKKDHKFELL